MAKATTWINTDTDRRKLGERMGLETPVVQSRKRWMLSIGHLIFLRKDMKCSVLLKVNTLNIPPEEYGRKIKTQRT